MKKLTQFLYILFGVIAFYACKDDKQGEVVSQDLSYQLDANYVFVDIPEKFPFDPSNIVYLDGQTIIKLTAKNDGTETTINEGTEFTFNVKLKKPLDQDINVNLVKAMDLAEGHAFIEFPDEAYELEGGTITAGKKEGTITLHITNKDLLNTMPGYVLPFRLDFVDAISGVKISTQSYSVLVEVSVKVGKENIDTSTEAIEGEYFNDNVTFDSDSYTSTLKYLYDGELDYPGWSPANKSSWITMTFSAPTKVLGIRINTYNHNYYGLSKFNVYADEGKGFISYGSVDRNVTSVIYIKFKKPVEIYALKFDGMLTGRSSIPEIYEITFIK